MKYGDIGLLLPSRGLVIGGVDPVPIDILNKLAQRADSGGFDSVWVGDSLIAKPRLEPLSLLGSIAAITNNVRIGTAVLLGALREPILLAQAAATVDLVSKGRLNLGIGVGGGFNKDQQGEWIAAGIDQKTRAKRFEEIVEIIKLLWSGETINFQGDHFNLEEVSLGFRPFQRPTIPIRLATHSGPGREKQYLRAAKIADGIISISDSPDEFRQVISNVETEAKNLNRNTEHFHNVYYLTVNINDNHDVALKESDDWIKKYYGLNFWTDKWGPFGSTSAIKDRIIQYFQSGADEVVVRFASYDQPGQLDQFEQKILPELL